MPNSARASAMMESKDGTSAGSISRISVFFMSASLCPSADANKKTPPLGRLSGVESYFSFARSIAGLHAMWADRVIAMQEMRHAATVPAGWRSCQSSCDAPVHRISALRTSCHNRAVSTLPPCPQCKSTLTYDDGVQLVCPECGHEWKETAAPVADESAPAVRDAFGNVLIDGDSVTVIKDLKVK